MSKFNLFFVLSVATAMTASVALADTGKGGDGKDPGQEPGKTTPISWDEFVQRCTHPKDFPNQLEPQNIKIQCTDVSRDYVASAPGEVPLNSVRQVVTAVFADKLHVEAAGREYQSDPKSGSCLRFKEVEKTLTIERPLTCPEILGLKIDIQDYCAQSLDMAKGANPKLIDVKETGNVIDTCGPVVGPPKGDPGKNPGPGPK